MKIERDDAVAILTIAGTPYSLLNAFQNKKLDRRIRVLAAIAKSASKAWQINYLWGYDDPHSGP